MNEVKQLLKQRAGLLKEIQKMPIWVNGSVIESIRKYQGRETPFCYLSQSIKGKNKTTYISAKDLDKFKVAAKEGLRLKELLSELNTVNIQLIKVGYND
jgi:hypothetical protein